MTNALAVLMQVQAARVTWPHVWIDVALVAGLAGTWIFAWRCCRRVSELEQKTAYLEKKLGDLYHWASAFYTDYKNRMVVCCRLQGDPTFPPTSDPTWP